MSLPDTLFSQASPYLSQEQFLLISDVQNILHCLQHNHINDYSFIVAPAAKAYEGFLKDFFLKLDIIDKYNYESDRFRVGKTLNPSLRYRRFSIYKKLSDLHDKGEELAEKLWSAWKQGRNEIFHYFPGNIKKLTRDEAESRIELILQTITQAGHFIDQYHQDFLV